MRKYKLSLTIKSLLLVSFIILSVVAVDYFSFESTKKYLLERELGYLRTVTDAHGSELLMFLESRFLRIRDLAGDALVMEAARNMRKEDSHALSAYLANQKMPDYRQIYRLSILGLDGRVIASSSDSHLGKNDSNEEYFKNTLKNIWISEKDDGFTGGPDIVFTSMISDPKTGSPLGVAAGFMTIAELERVLRGEFAREYLGIDVRRSGPEMIEIVIINRNKLLLSHSPFVEGSVLKQTADTLPVRSCLEKNKKVTGIWMDYRGVEVAGASLCLPSLKWAIVYKIDKETIFEPSAVVGRYSLIAVIATVILVGILTTFFIRLVVVQLRRLSKASGEIARGNYDIVLPVRTNDELGSLSASFNEMAAKIKERSRDLKESEEEVIKLNRELETRVETRTMELEKAVSELADLNREIETFTYSAAHDLRNPLVIIDAFSLILSKRLKGRLDSDEQEHLDSIRETVKRMGQLIDDLMNLSVAMRSELVFGTIDLSAVAGSMAADLRKAGPERPVEFRIEEGLKAYGDEKLIRMALENLIGNAWKFTSKKTEQKIEFGSAGKKDKRVVFFVRDNGAGFDMKDADRLFEPFKRLHATKDFPGTGVGLATVKRIIQRHGGEVWAEGSPDNGAVFYFTLESAR